MNEKMTVMDVEFKLDAWYDDGCKFWSHELVVHPGFAVALGFYPGHHDAWQVSVIDLALAEAGEDPEIWEGVWFKTANDALAHYFNSTDIVASRIEQRKVW